VKEDYYVKLRLLRSPSPKNLRVRGRMNPPSMETIFLILSGVILFAGVIYWMWSHLQLTQKKVQLLENAVFELRAMIPGGGTAGPPPSAFIPPPTPTVSSGPTKTYNDLADDDWDGEEVAQIKEVVPVSTPLEALSVTPAPTPAVPEVAQAPELITRELEMTSDDLMPGGRIQLGVDVTEEAIAPSSGPSAEEEFKNLLKSRAVVTASASSSEAPALEGMPLKELRRLGEQRGIVGAMEMRKKELLAALRASAAPPAKATATLDLATVEAEAAGEADADVVMPATLEEAEILE
jgi:hypothetical protein